MLNRLLISGQLVGLCTYEHGRDAYVLQPFRQFQVQHRRLNSCVHEMQDKDYRRPLLEIGLNQLFPLAIGGSWDPSVPIARQIYEKQRAIDPIEIYALGLARRRTGSGEIFPT